MKKKWLFTLVGSALVVLLAWTAWNIWFSSTKVAFVHYQAISLGRILKANDNSFIKISELSTEELDKLTQYDMVFINGMGLRITEEQRAKIQTAVNKGVPILTTAATNPDNKFVSLDSIQADTLKKYLGNGGRQNYRSMLNYVRKHIDKKIISVNEPEALLERAEDMIYHAEKEDEVGFNTVAAYHEYLRRKGLWKEDAPRIIVTGAMGEPAELIAKLEETGSVVYPVRLLQGFIRGHHIDSVRPSAIINMAHGRLGDFVVRYLQTANIPLFCPLNVNRLVEEWEEDKMGMSGGFLSQSVVTPEIDGGLRSFALFGNYKDREGLQYNTTIPERLETFVQCVNNYIALKKKPNSEKRVAIYYFKGPGQSALTAGGMEVAPSLYNLLVQMRKEGYRVDNLPASARELEQMIQKHGAIFGGYAEGALETFMREGSPALVSKTEYEAWVKKALRPEKYAEVVALNGEFPGNYMSTPDGKLGVARLQLGNIVLLPQPAAGSGDNSFKIVHGTDAAPPHPYIASYLWTQFAFKADALVHFGTHGSLEFTPKKQVALGHGDWPDRLVGALPHFYVYTIGNVGEGIIAKRRSYAGLQSYLTPPFLESNVRGMYRDLAEKIKIYNQLLGAEKRNDAAIQKASLAVKEATMRVGIHRELELDSIRGKAYTEEDILRIENFAEELATEKITGQLYTMGVPYEDERIRSSVFAMSTDPIAYSLYALDKLRGRAGETVLKQRAVFTKRYLEPARELVGRLIANPTMATDEFICQLAGVSKDSLTKAHEIEQSKSAPQRMMAMMMSVASEAPAEAQKHRDTNKKTGMMSSTALDMAKKMGASEEDLRKMAAKMNGGKTAGEKPQGHPAMAAKKQSKGNMSAMKKESPKYTKAEMERAMALLELERTVKNVGRYKEALLISPQEELRSMLNAMSGGYTAPSPGGDPIANPNTLPTGRNMYSINAEATPSESAWEKGKQLANNTIEMYRKRHNDSLPRKVSYTLWSGEFIETEGATIAQILYMLGVEPLRDAFGRVTDLRLIPSKELGRPRIDVVVQTSGQLRDLAASRLFLINRAVEMAAQAKDDEYENQVAEGVVEAERALIEKGITPKDAREISTYRVFGGMNGGYGTGIQGMVMSSDRWESEKEIADTYLNNMGAYYGSEKNWEVFKQYAFEAALTRTDAVVQPRQSNTWGALSLDHVYEFMGGLNLAVRNVTGKDPDAYLSDYRNRNNVRMQEVKEAIGVESRTTIFNPNYIREKMKGGAGAASGIAETVQNTFGWNVMKPRAIDKEMWDEIYNVYVKDKFELGLQAFFEANSPAALEEITAVMMESARKGYWKANAQQLADVAKLHTDLVNRFKPSCSGFVCDNAKLRQFIASKTDATTAETYKRNVDEIRQASFDGDKKGVVMKKEGIADEQQKQKQLLNNWWIGGLVLVLLFALAVFIRKRRNKMKE